MKKDSEIIQFKISLGKFQADINLDPPQKNILALTGKSGSGKSTLAKVICGIHKPHSGEIVINDTTLFSSEKKINLSPNLRNIGMVFQEPRLFTHMSVQSNLLYGQKKKNISDMKLFEKIVDLLDIKDLLNRKVPNLSGGEAQRISIGRAVLSRPKLLILDEPLIGLDVERQQKILSIIKNINIESNIPIIFISHSVDEIVFISESIALIENGKILTQGPTNKILYKKGTKLFGLETEESTLIKCKIIDQNIKEKFTKVSSEGTNIIISKISGSIGSGITLRLFAKDVSIATEKPKNISINNIFEAIVSDTYSNNILGRINIELKVGRNKIISSILENSLKKLQISKNDKVYALIKSISVVGQTKTY